MKFKFAAVAAALLLSQSAMADGMPQACPDAAQLAAVGVSMAGYSQQVGGWFGVTPSNNFGTADEWTLIAGPVDAQDQQAVVNQVNEKLSGLGEPMGPMADQQNEMYGCVYFNQQGDFYGVTVTPAMSMDGTMKFDRATSFMRQAKKK